MKSDRILYLTEDRSEVVEQGDPRAATLFALVGTDVPDADVSRYGLTFEADKPADDLAAKMANDHRLAMDANAPATVKSARQDQPFQAPPKADEKGKPAQKGK